MAVILTTPLLLAAAALSPADARGVEAEVAAIYRPYQRGDDGTAAWDRPVWSAAVRALVAQWKRVMPEGEVDDLNDGDWLCQCQDWDNARFRATVTQLRPQAPGVVLASVRIDLGFGPPNSARFVMRREGARWLADDLFSRDFPRGLKQALRETIAADRKLKK